MSGPITPTPHTILDGAGRIGADLACINCGYNLRTLPADGNCPECGHLVAETAAGYLPILDQEGRVAGDLPCVSCGYNLRMQPASGLCPECAASVARSACGHYLHHAPPAWLKRMAGGALLLVIALCATVAVPLGMLLIALLVSIAGGGTGEEVLVSLFFGLVIVVGVVMLWLIIRGLVDLTAPDPAAKFRREGVSARKLVRYCLLALPVCIVGAFVSQRWSWWLVPGPRGPGPTAVVLIVIFSVLSTGVYALLVLAVLRHIVALMRRVPKPGLVTFAKIEFWFFLLGIVVYLGGTVFVMFAGFRTVAALPMGPNTPGFAAGPNAPGGVATTTAPALTALGYTSPGSVTFTQVGPGGTTTVTTTMPTTAPIMVTPPAFGPVFFLASTLMMVGGCGMLGVGVAGFVLLILVQRALAGAARQAAAIALPE